MNRTILQGDVLEKLTEIPDESIDCIISSPPYWSLRDYGVEGQLGLEPDFRDYLKIMSNIMDELKRVLKKTGTCWINLGDSYWGGNGGPDSFERKQLEKEWNDKSVKMTDGLQRKKQWELKLVPIKSRVGIPERFYINCIDNGWIARNHIPWYKSNSMPSSVKDRFTNKWESIFFFAKAQKYYFNLDAVREKTKGEYKPFAVHVRDHYSGRGLKKYGKQARLPSANELPKYNHDGTIKEKYANNPQSNVARLHKDRIGNPNNDYLENKPSKYSDEKQSNGNRIGKFRNKERFDNKQDSTLGADGKPVPTYKGFNERYNSQKTTFTLNDISKLTDKKVDELTPTEICKLIGYDPEKSCLNCGRSNKRHVTTDRGITSHDNYPIFVLCNPKGKNPGDVFFINPKPFKEAHFATFPIDLPLKILKCACPPNGIVLDPFFGAGTVGVAAEKLGLQWIGIELNAEYKKMALKRLEKFNMAKLEAFL